MRLRPFSTQTDIDGNATVITKDDFGNILSVTKNGTAIETNTYGNGLLKTSVKNGIFRSFAYDGKQRLTGYYSGDGKGVVYTYDNKSGLIKKQSGGGRNYSCTYSNDSQKRLTRVDGEAYTVKNYGYDVLGREINRSVYLMATPIDKVETTYLKKGDHATNIPSSLRFWDKTTSGFKDRLNYVYDKLGNISKIYENGKLLVRYAYDGVNRLIREDNRDFNESYFFSYDKTGNITSKRTCPFTLEETEKISAFTTEDVFSYKSKNCMKMPVLCENFAILIDLLVICSIINVYFIYGCVFLRNLRRLLWKKLEFKTIYLPT